MLISSEAASPAKPPIPLWEKVRSLLSAPVNGTSLALFRIGFGIVMFLEALTLFRGSASSGGRSHMETYFTGTAGRFHFPYAAFGWLPTLPDWAMEGLGWSLAAGAILLFLGLWHRLAAILVLVSWGYLYAIESTRTYWMSYYYLELLVAFLMVWMPASNRYSIDATRSLRPPGERTVPFWCIALLRGQLVITYFYAGVAKLTHDWMIDFMPVKWFLTQPHVEQRLDSFLGSSLASQVKPWLLGNTGAGFLSWTGATFDLLVGFLLLARRTRFLGLALMWTFHGLNHFLLFTDIEWFPLVGATTALIFLDPDWPERVGRWFRRPGFRAPNLRWAIPGALLLPGYGMLLGWQPNRSQAGPRIARSPNSSWVAVACITWMAWQTLMPIRHLLIPGDTRITFEGLSFSWRLKAELYQSRPATLLVDDSKVLSSSNGTNRVDWAEWRGEKILYREIVGGQVPWKDLAPIVAISEPGFGERILFNPEAAGIRVTTETQARETAARLWQALHGHPPAALHRPLSIGQMADAYTKAAQTRGIQLPDRAQAAALMLREHGPAGNGQMLPFLRRTQAFASGLDDVSPGWFLWIEDPAVMQGTSKTPTLIDRTRWRSGPSTLGQLDAHRLDVNGSPLILHAEDPMEAGSAYPERATLWQSTMGTDPAPEIRWDTLSDVGVSKAMHIGVNPFLLRRYARHVARLWNPESSERPAIHARTHVALNRRPLQPVVDLRADLASVHESWFTHNPWILDLTTARIPPGFNPQASPR